MGLPALVRGGGGFGALGPPWGTILAIGIVEIAMPRLGGLEAPAALRHVWIRKLYSRIAAAERVTSSAPRSGLRLCRRPPRHRHRLASCGLRGAEQACTRRGVLLFGLPSISDGNRCTVAVSNGQEVTLGEGLGDLARSASRAARTRRAQRAPEENFEPTRPLHAISALRKARRRVRTEPLTNKRALSKARCAGALRARRCAPASGTAYR